MKADFFASIVSVGESTKFIDISTGNVKSRKWELESNVFSWNKEAEYLFKKAGTYSIRLTIFDQEGKEKSITKTVYVLKKQMSQKEEAYEVYEPEVIRDRSYHNSNGDYYIPARSDLLDKQLEEIENENRWKSIPVFMLFVAIFGLIITASVLLADTNASENAGFFGKVLYVLSKLF